MPTTDTTLTAHDSNAMHGQLPLPNNAYQQYKLDSMQLAHRTEIEIEAIRNDVPMVGMVAIFIPIVAILCAFVMVFRSIAAKRAVKLALIEKGMDAALLVEPVNENSRKYSALRYGLLLSGLGLGLIIGFVISTALNLFGDQGAWVTMGSSAFFAGLGLVVYHIMAKRSEPGQS